MLRAITAPALDGVPDLVHGFEQRLGLARGEDREESRRRVGRALEGRGRLLLLKQVHGAAVAVAPWEERPEADAAVATGPRLLLGIETADCLLILIVDPRRRTVAAAHAGWRGTASGVAARAVEALVAAGSAREDLLAALEQLAAAGLRPHRIHHVRDCTACRADLYHSYRRDGPGAGRMINFVGWE